MSTTIDIFTVFIYFCMLSTNTLSQLTYKFKTWNCIQQQKIRKKQYTFYLKLVNSLPIGTCATTLGWMVFWQGTLIRAAPQGGTVRMTFFNYNYSLCNTFVTTCTYPASVPNEWLVFTNLLLKTKTVVLACTVFGGVVLSYQFGLWIELTFSLRIRVIRGKQRKMTYMKKLTITCM